MPDLTLKFETALELVEALQSAVERLELNNCEGEESPFIAKAGGALARLYALPGVRAAVDAKESTDA